MAVLPCACALCAALTGVAPGLESSGSSCVRIDETTGFISGSRHSRLRSGVYRAGCICFATSLSGASPPFALVGLAYFMPGRSSAAMWR